MGLLEDIEKRKQARRERFKQEGPNRESFMRWRLPRLGVSNPEELTNPFWSYAIKEGGSGWSFKGDFDGPDSFQVQPSGNAENEHHRNTYQPIKMSTGNTKREPYTK